MLWGPAPLCRAAGTVRVWGVRGVNHVEFSGRVGGRPVRPGVYVLTLTRASSERPVMRPLLVKVVSPRRTILLGAARADRCDSPAVIVHDVGAFTPGAALPTPVATLSESSASASASHVPGRSASPPASTPTRPARNHEVLGVDVHVPALPEPEEWVAWQFAVAVLLVGLPLLLMLALVVRFVRGSWNP